MRIITIIFIIAIILPVGLAAVEVPNIINFQGYLTDGSGAVDGTIEATFRI